MHIVHYSKKPIDQHSSESCVYEAIIIKGTLKHLTNTLNMVKKEYIYEVTSLTS